jgi:hypothetical protein
LNSFVDMVKGENTKLSSFLSDPDKIRVGKLRRKRAMDYVSKVSTSSKDFLSKGSEESSHSECTPCFVYLTLITDDKVIFSIF